MISEPEEEDMSFWLLLIILISFGIGFMTGLDPQLRENTCAPKQATAQ